MEGRSSADEQVDTLRQAMANINVADLTPDEFRRLRDKLLKFEEKLAQRLEVLAGTGTESKSV